MASRYRDSDEWSNSSSRPSRSGERDDDSVSRRSPARSPYGADDYPFDEYDMYDDFPSYDRPKSRQGNAQRDEGGSMDARSSEARRPVRRSAVETRQPRDPNRNAPAKVRRSGSGNAGAASSPDANRGYGTVRPIDSRYSRSSRTYGGRSANYQANDSQVGGQYARSSEAYSHKTAKKAKSRGKKILLGVVLALVAVIAVGGIAAAKFISDINGQLSAGKSEEEKLAINEKLKRTTNFNEPFYMLLIGSDARDFDDTEGQRSDTNILCRVDPVNNKVSMLSIPRDTLINIKGVGDAKFNAAYNYGGVPEVIDAAHKLCKVDIAHYAEVSFDQLVSLVDAVGGVEVDVPELIDDPDAGLLVIQPGLQTLNGEQALVFARCRAYADGDFTRTSNQRLLVEALVKKILALPPTELPGVLNAAARCVSTDLTVEDLGSLVLQFKDVSDLTIYSAMLPSYTQDYDGVSYVVVDDKLLAKMMKLVEEGKDPNTLDTGGMASIGSSTNDNKTIVFGADGSVTETGSSNSSSSGLGTSSSDGTDYSYDSSGYYDPYGYDPYGTYDSDYYYY